MFGWLEQSLNDSEYRVQVKKLKVRKTAVICDSYVDFFWFSQKRQFSKKKVAVLCSLKKCLKTTRLWTNVQTKRHTTHAQGMKVIIRKTRIILLEIILIIIMAREANGETIDRNQGIIQSRATRTDQALLELRATGEAKLLIIVKMVISGVCIAVQNGFSKSLWPGWLESIAILCVEHATSPNYSLLYPSYEQFISVPSCMSIMQQNASIDV